MFDAINTSGTGLTVYRTWVDAIANNIANVNDVSPTSGAAFQAQYVQAQPVEAGPDGVGHGVEMTGLKTSSANGIPTYDPQNPLADANGYVRRPDIDMGEQMGNLIMAQRAFEANANLVDREAEVYKSAIDIGKGV
ncbi:MAG TPA: flagellar basal body rod C-terminal domain-containing protein [Jatrophihabitans sp.]|nr:flagellar basal body rod C-terminal domain-containing protein [Jatrophihabitans sp.]